MENNFTPETARTVAGVDAFFFLIQPDGSIKFKNEFGKATAWCFQMKASAVHAAARRPGVRVWDKHAGAFL